MSSGTVHELFKDVGWLKALTLGERALTLTTVEALTADSNTPGNSRALERFERWHSQPAFNDQAHFASRLKSEGLTSSQLLYLLGDGAASLAERCGRRPEWLTRLERAFSQAGDCQSSLDLPAGFIKGLEPLISPAVVNIRERIRRLQSEYKELPFEPEEVVSLFLPSLISRLFGCSTRTLVLELNVARLQEMLEGETSEQRYAYFNQLLERPDFLLPILNEYPVLTRHIMRNIDYWEADCLEILTRLCADWGEIKSAFSPSSEPGLLEGLLGEAGDTHREGRSVKILKFSEGFKVLYKPHPLSVDIHFGELLHWLNERGEHPPLRSAGVVDRGDYGWVEFIHAGECSSDEEVRRFYVRQGGLLALLHALEATDFHLENLIAAGEHPVLIDLESLFHPRQKSTLHDTRGLSSALDAMTNSVLRVGMLPQRIWGGDGKDGVDLSGMGGAAGQLTPFPVLTYENWHTDEMKIVRKRMEIAGSQNRPRLGEQDVDIVHYKDDIIAGFASVYRLLLRERERLLESDGPLSSFARDELRAVLRPTRIYASLLTESFHPDVLRDALEQERLLDCLWERTKRNPELSPMVLAEIRDLQRGDIPMFTCRPDSLDIWTSRKEHIPNFFAEESLNVVERRLRSLSEEDLSTQLWFISASISSLSLGVAGSIGSGYKLAPRERVAEREEFLKAVRDIADRLEALALREEAHVNWIGLALVGQRNWTLLPLVDTLYDGTLGVALFLAYAGDLLEEERYTALARAALNDACMRFEKLRDELKNIDDKDIFAKYGVGGYSGVGSLIYVLAHVGSLWEDPAILATAEACIDLLPEFVEADESLDIINGSAGCILNLLALYQVTASERALAIARTCAERIIGRAQKMERGVGWSPSSGTIDPPLAGFSHGASGIACALLKFAEVTGETKYAEVAFAGFEYERSLFSPEKGNWPDLRVDAAIPVENGPPFMTMWCHGAPGIGLSRVHALKHVADDGLVADEIRVAVEATLRNGFNSNHSLCHGALGNLEFLYEAGRALGNAGLIEEAQLIAGSLLDSIESAGHICGTPNGTETPGLMTGLAGIGYGLLRMVEPGRIPSALVLAPPTEQSTKSKVERTFTGALTQECFTAMPPDVRRGLPRRSAKWE